MTKESLTRNSNLFDVELWRHSKKRPKKRSRVTGGAIPRRRDWIMNRFEASRKEQSRALHVVGFPASYLPGDTWRHRHVATGDNEQQILNY